MSPEAANPRSSPGRDRWLYLLGACLGGLAGIAEVRVGDLLLTAVLVLISTMLLGMLRPQRPWRWVLLVASFVPALVLLAFVFLAEKPYPAQVYESFLGFLTGAAGAYAGALGRRAFDEIWRK